MKKYLSIILAVLLVAALVWGLVLNGNNASLNKDKTALTEQVTGLNDKVTELTGNLTAEKASSAELTEQITKLTSDAEQAAKDAQAALDQAKADAQAALDQAKADAQTSLTQVQSELDSVAAKAKEDASQLKEAVQSKAKLEKDLAALQETISSQETAIQEAQTLKESLDTALASAEANIKQLTEDLNKARDEAASATAQAQTQTTELQAKLDSAIAEKNELAAQIQAMEAAAESMLSKGAVPGKEEAQDIVILYTSDIHCAVDQNYGFVGLAAKRNELVEEGNAVLLVDNGDAIQGEPAGTLTKGKAIVDIMNAVGYDVVTVGNHDFDYGMANFMELSKEHAKYSIVSCNFNYQGELVFPPYLIKEVAGRKIAFIGITTPNTFITSTPTYFQDENGNYIYGFCEGNNGQNLYDAVQKAIDDARAEGADYIVALAHLGTEAEATPYKSTDVIANTTGLDVLLDGHEHATLACEEDLDKEGNIVLRSACGTKFANIGYMKISGDGTLSTGLYMYDKVGTDAATVQAISDATEVLDKELETVIGHTDVDLVIADPKTITEDNPKGDRIVRCMETNLGDLCADAVLDQSGADVAVMNGGNVRIAIPAGDITKNDIFSVHPFGNEMTVVEATGQQILDALEWSSRNLPGESGGFLQVAGLTYEVDAYLPNPCEQDDHGGYTGITGERRVHDVMIGNEPLDPEKNYSVASIDYILKKGGDGTNMFMDCKVLQDKVKLDNQVLMDYISDTLGGNIGEEYANPYGSGRIVIHAEPAAESEEPAQLSDAA